VIRLKRGCTYIEGNYKKRQLYILKNKFGF
jgi:hypothetical protein